MVCNREENVMRYWKNGFYGIPIEGSVEITDEYWHELLLGQSQGKRIVSDDTGYPILADPPAPTTDELADKARMKRDAFLKEVVDSVNPMRWEALTELQKDAWRAYRQALLDVPQQEGFPTNIAWPEAPA
jgi:hypothetical protein